MKKPVSKDIFDGSDFPISDVRMGVFQGTGADLEEAKVKPIIAIVNSHTEINPGHAHLANLAMRVREGVFAAGGIPFEFNVPAPCDGISEGHPGMKFILPQRDLIADMVEIHVRSMRFDGMVMIASCDKIIPGMLMAAARLDLPTVFLTGGPSEMVLRQRKTSCSSVNFPDHSDPADQMGCLTSGSCGACEIIGTANTFQCIAEALGMTLPGSANIPGYTADKARVARACGRQIVKNVQEGLTARQIMTKESLINALLLVQAVGGSTNTALHLPAIARELGLELTLEEFNVAAKKVPTLCAIAPNGPYGVLDLYRSGGVPGVLKRIAEDLDLNCGNTFGGTLQDVVANAQITDENVIPERSNCHYPEGGLVALFGNLAPEGSVVKQSAVDPNMYKFSGPARIFESEHACLEAIRNKTIQEGEVVVIRNEGPKGGPGMPETLAVTIGLKLLGLQRVALITDGRFSGATSGPCVGHVSPEAADGGPIAALDDGDIIRIDIPSRAIAVELSDEALKERLASRKPSPHAPVDGYMQRYVSTVTSAAKGAVLEKP